ncbi:hypothetical protein [Patulibacter sp.]|uniref:hypothetical protein n=1 Tax=Patulibacter sp. TaxID=1912859 RepID=UPI002727E9DA|nr:hypothetical protein [Patulibacter sp.]MDO9408585.1 hypothetical protein [Patulibacter sp.]
MSRRIWLAAGLLAAPFPIFTVLYALGGTSTESIEYVVIVLAPLAPIAALTVLLAVVLIVRRATRRPIRKHFVLAALLIGAAVSVGVSSPVEMTWKEQCNFAGGVVPAWAAAPVAAGITEIPEWSSGTSTLAGCLGYD